MNIKKLFIKISFTLFVVAFYFLAITSQVKAGPLKPVDVTGWAWSSNVGWISFNCINTGTCGTVSYGVKLATSTSDALAGTLSGYAWSSNVGWIEFAGDTSLGFPSPTIDLDKGGVSGYIRVCSGTIPPPSPPTTTHCSTNASRTDGWDGWAKLSESPLYSTRQNGGDKGVTYITSDGSFVGYAWGGENIGWLQFNASSTSGNVKCPSCTNNPPSTFTPSCTIPSTVSYTAPATSGTVAVSASSFDGSASYTFSIPVLTNMPVGPYTSPSIQVTDSSSPTKIGNMVCSTTVVNGSPVPPGVSMWTMQNQASTDKTKFLVAIKLGQDAYVNWEAVGGMTYDVNACVARLVDPSSASSVLSGLNSQPVNGYYKIPASALTSKGDYKYSMRCTDTNSADTTFGLPVSAKSTDPNSPLSLTIKVKDPKEIEK